MGQLFEFILNHPFLVTAFVVLLVMLVMNEFKRKLLGFNEIDVNETVKLINHEDAAVLDVREPDEYREGHIKGAIHIPLGLLEGQLDKLEKYRDHPLVVYCRSGQRAAKAAAILQRQGFSKIYKMNGGMMAWTSANMPVSRRR